MTNQEVALITTVAVAITNAATHYATKFAFLRKIFTEGHGVYAEIRKLFGNATPAPAPVVPVVTPPAGPPAAS